MIHKCLKSQKVKALIWKVFNHWRLIDDNKIHIVPTYSNGMRIDKCPYCRKSLSTKK